MNIVILDIARYTVCVDRNGLLRIELERCNERRYRNVESRSVNERNVPLMHLHANDGTFFSPCLPQKMTILSQNYMDGVIIRKYLDAKLRKNINTVAITAVLQLQYVVI